MVAEGMRCRSVTDHPALKEGGGASKAGRTACGGEQLVAADPATGQRRVLTSLPDRALVILPGD